MRALGIDISHHQGDWDPAKMDRRIRFVIHKATEGASGPKSVDSACARNRGIFDSWISEDVDRDCLWGAFHVLHESSKVDPQVVNFAQHADLEPGDLVALDTETGSEGPGPRDDTDIKGLVERYGTEGARDFVADLLDGLEELTGGDPLWYYSERGLKHLTGRWREPLGERLTRRLRHTWWMQRADITPDEALVEWARNSEGRLPSRPDRVPEWRWLLWQFTSSQPGSFAGVSGEHVDVNVCRDLDALRRCAVPAKARIEPLPSERQWGEAAIRRALQRLPAMSAYVDGPVVLTRDGLEDALIAELEKEP